MQFQTILMEFLQYLGTSLFNQLSSKLTSTYLVHDLISDHVPNTILLGKATIIYSTWSSQWKSFILESTSKERIFLCNVYNIHKLFTSCQPGQEYLPSTNSWKTHDWNPHSFPPASHQKTSHLLNSTNYSHSPILLRMSKKTCYHSQIILSWFCQVVLPLPSVSLL